MTPSECIMGRLSKGPAGASSLACELHNHCEVPFDQVYPVLFEHVDALIKANRVEHIPSIACYRLTTKECPDQFEKEEE